ncbi:unnamed protein product [Closterium sp. NIES-54]
MEAVAGAAAVPAAGAAAAVATAAAAATCAAATAAAATTTVAATAAAAATSAAATADVAAIVATSKWNVSTGAAASATGGSLSCCWCAGAAYATAGVAGPTGGSLSCYWYAGGSLCYCWCHWVVERGGERYLADGSGLVRLIGGSSAVECVPKGAGAVGGGLKGWSAIGLFRLIVHKVYIWAGGTGDSGRQRVA